MRERHGMRNTPEYGAWCEMKRRCFNKNRPNYKNWGGRGITMSLEWQDSFLAFYKDIGPRPTPKHSLDRINNDGNYEPGNVRWATRVEQSLNRRSERAKSGYKGVYWYERLNKWLAQIHYRPHNINLGYYQTAEEAAWAYDGGAIQLYDDAAVLNFPTG